MWWLAKQIKLARGIWAYHGDARGWALGVALGFLLGFVPKGNLTAVVLSLVFFSLRTNVALGLITATLVSFVAPMLDPVTHAVGNTLLSSVWLRPLWIRLHGLPLVPWLHWNNTVVLGSLLLGLAATYPVYRLVLAVGQRYERSRRRPVALLPAPAVQVARPDVDPPVLVVPPAHAASHGVRVRSPWRGRRVA